MPAKVESSSETAPAEPAHTYDQLNGLEAPTSAPVVIEPPKPVADVHADVTVHKPAADYAKSGA